MRQVNAAEQEITRQIQTAREKWRDENPRDWETEEAWKKAHPSPHDKAVAKLEAAESKLKEKRDQLLFDAKMGNITPEQLTKCVKSFLR